MKRVRLTLRDVLAAALATKDTASSSSASPQTGEADDQTLIQKQLAEARREAQNALAEWRSYPTPYYEAVWNAAIAKIQRLEARIPKRKAASRG